MSAPLYLDTARIGLLTLEASQACEDAIALATHDPNRAFGEFQTDQSSDSIRHWNGIQQLFADILSAFDNPTGELVVASESASLLNLAGRCLFTFGRKVFVPDLVWPNHLTGLRTFSRFESQQIYLAKCRRQIVEGVDNNSFVMDMARQYELSGCDSLFLTAVSSDGIRFPIDQLLSEIEKTRKPRFIVIDGAQEFAHLDYRLNTAGDLYLFSAHKWLGAYHPMSLGMYGRKSSKPLIEKMLARMIDQREINDPTLKASAANNFDYQETINLLPFFSLAGAMQSLADRDHDTSFENRRYNASTFSEVAAQSGWTDRYASLDEEFRTAISVIEKPDTGPNPIELQHRLHRSGVAATVLDDGGIRASMPARPFENQQLETISKMLSSF